MPAGVNPDAGPNADSPLTYTQVNVSGANPHVVGTNPHAKLDTKAHAKLDTKAH